MAVFIVTFILGLMTIALWYALVSNTTAVIPLTFPDSIAIDEGTLYHACFIGVLITILAISVLSILSHLRRRRR